MQIHAQVKVDARDEQTMVRMGIDSGAERTVLDEKIFEAFEPKPTLTRLTSPLFPFGGKENAIEQLGAFVAVVKANGRMRLIEIRVVKGRVGCLLDHTTARYLGLYQLAEFSQQELE